MSSASQTANPTRPAPSPEVLEEYKIINDSAATASDRRQRTNDVYVTINALFLSGIGILLISSNFTSWRVSVEVAVISLVVIPVNWAWTRAIVFYQRVLSTHYECLIDIESRFQLATNLNQKLGSIHSRPGPVPARIGSGRTLAYYFLVLYPLITVAVAAITYFTTNHIVVFG